VIEPLARRSQISKLDLLNDLAKVIDIDEDMKVLC
jgi:hypothetical protein